MIERTLVLLKPDALQRGLVGRIINRLEDAGCKIVGCQMRLVDDDLARRHYSNLEQRVGADVFATVIRYMRSGPIIALAIEADGAVATVRKLVGATFPSQAAPGTIRGDWCHQGGRAAGDPRAVFNLVHASGSPDEAAAELSLWFGPDQTFAYTRADEAFTV